MALQEYGFEIGSHSWQHTNLTTLTLEQAEEQVRKSFEWLTEWRFNSQNFAPPENAYNIDIIEIISKYHKSMVRSSSNNQSTSVFDREVNNDIMLQIPRYDLSGTVDKAGLKEMLDYVKANDKVICIMIHNIVTGTATSPNTNKDDF